MITTFQARIKRGSGVVAALTTLTGIATVTTGIVTDTVLVGDLTTVAKIKEKNGFRITHHRIIQIGEGNPISLGLVKTSLIQILAPSTRIHLTQQVDATLDRTQTSDDLPVVTPRTKTVLNAASQDIPPARRSPGNQGLFHQTKIAK